MNPLEHKAINLQGIPLSVEILRTFEAFAGTSDIEAQAIVEALTVFAGLIVRTCSRMNDRAIVEARIIDFTPSTKEIKKAA